MVSGCFLLFGDDDDDNSEFFQEPLCDENTPEWVFLPGAYFTMGTDSGDEDEGPAHIVNVGSFEIMRFEVTVAQYDKCILEGACPGHDYHCSVYDNYAWKYKQSEPMNCVDLQNAIDFCEWIGGRLPSEAEWEYAASSGGTDRPYPWGDETPTSEHAVWHENPYYNSEVPGTSPVCSHPDGQTTWGLFDMAGNVAEWVADSYHSSYTGAPDDGSAWVEEEEGHAGEHVRRGGGHRSYTTEIRVTARESDLADLHKDYAGFRCVR